MERRESLLLSCVVYVLLWATVLGWWLWRGLLDLRAQVEHLAAQQQDVRERLEGLERLLDGLDELHRVAEAMERLGSDAGYWDRLAMAAAVVSASRRYGVPVELVLAVGAVESNWRPTAVGPRGERGPLQVTPQTLWYLGMRCESVACEIEAGVRYLALQIERAGGREDLAAAYYHAGHNLSERRAMRKARTYVRKVARAYQALTLGREA